MSLEEQVVSLELSKKLKELGVTQESYFWWTNGRLLNWATLDMDEIPEAYAAFTVAELGEMMPESIKSQHVTPSDAWLGTQKFIDGKGWRIWYKRPTDEKDAETEAFTEADARAKMLIYLLENKLITINQIQTCGTETARAMPAQGE